MSENKREGIERTARQIVKEAARNGRRISHDKARERVRKAIIKTENKARR